MRLKVKMVEESYKYKQGETIDFNSTNISLLTGKRDWAGFQILLQADQWYTLSTGENTVFSPRMFESMHGHKTHPCIVRVKVSVNGLPEAEVKLWHIGLIEDDDGILKADVLLHDEAVFVEYGRIQSVWSEISVPEHAAPGVYRGVVQVFTHTMFEDEQIADEVDFTLTVKNVVLPRPTEYTFYLDLWQHLSNIARKHEVQLWSEEHFKVLETYIQSLGELGQKAVTLVASEIPWSGQGCFRVSDYLSNLFEYSMIRVSKKSTGEFEYDFSVVERYINLCFQYGINQEIEVFGLVNIWIDEECGYGTIAQDYPDAIRIRYFDEQDGCWKFIRVSSEIKQYIKALENFFIEKNLIDRVRIVADEPSDIVLYKERISLLREIAPSFRYKTAINHAEFIGEFHDVIDDFVPILPCVVEGWEKLNVLRDRINGRLLWYVCCFPDMPNTFIRSPLLESRFIGLFTAYMGFDGFLRWNYTVWPENPRQRIAYWHPMWKAGDMNFVYPAQDGRPLLTLRYKNLKRGIEDFELIQRLKESHKNSEAVLDSIWSKLLKTTDISDFDPSKEKKADELYSLNYEDYQWVRETLLDELAKA